MPSITTAPRVGDPAPVLDLPALDQDRVRLSDHAGQTVLVSFLRHAG